MVRCGKYEGETCKCQLMDVEVQQFLMRFFELSVKVITNRATNDEINELNNIGATYFHYLELFAQHSELLMLINKQD